MEKDQVFGLLPKKKRRRTSAESDDEGKVLGAPAHRSGEDQPNLFLSIASGEDPRLASRELEKREELKEEEEERELFSENPYD